MTVPIPRGVIVSCLAAGGRQLPSLVGLLDAFVTTARLSRRSDILPAEATSCIGRRGKLAELRQPNRPAAEELQKNRAQYCRVDVVSLPFETADLSIRERFRHHICGAPHEGWTCAAVDDQARRLHGPHLGHPQRHITYHRRVVDQRMGNGFERGPERRIPHLCHHDLGRPDQPGLKQLYRLATPSRSYSL